MVYAFKLYIKDELERRMRDPERDLHVITPDNSEVNVMHIEFQFYTRELLNDLKKRGDAKKKKNQALRRQIEGEIKDKIENDWDNMCYPQEAFITFESEEAYQRAIQFDKVKVLKQTISAE